MGKTLDDEDEDDDASVVGSDIYCKGGGAMQGGKYMDHPLADMLKSSKSSTNLNPHLIYKYAAPRERILWRGTYVCISVRRGERREQKYKVEVVPKRVPSLLNNPIITYSLIIT